MDFQPGDIVRLKSGGPIMTVSTVSAKAKLGTPSVQCEWFNQVDKAFELKSVSISAYSLRKIQKSPVRENPPESQSESLPE